MREKRLACDRCGTAAHEWQTLRIEERNGRLVERWENVEPAPYEVELYRCKGCEKLDARADKLGKMERHGLKVRLSKTGK